MNNDKPLSLNLDDEAPQPERPDHAPAGSAFGGTAPGHGRQAPLTLGAAIGAPSGGPPTSGGGSWTWQPAGMEPKRPWRKRHPIVFWGGLLLFLGLVFAAGRSSVRDAPLNGPRIAVIQVDGVILDAESIVGFMEKVRKDPEFKGAILRINSPGGAVGPSQELYAAAKRLSLAKPLVASMSSVAASGGYYAALGAKTILAGPSSITASIGVKMQIPNVEGLMRAIGVSETTLVTGDLKDAGSSWREMRPDEKNYFRTLINDMYEEFVAAVARERGLPLEQARAVADGRAMTGRQAREAGLVDELGDFHAAVSRVKELAGIPAEEEAVLVKGPEQPENFLARLLQSAANMALRQSSAAGQPVFMY